MSHSDQRYGLLIQGPLLSSGRSGATLLDRPFSDKSVVHFDCRDLITKTVLKYQKLFSEIIVCTWDDGIFTDYKLNCGQLIRIGDETGQLPKKEGGLGINPYLATNNMLRQYYGTYYGLKQFNGVDTVVKIRTDQELDLETIISSIKNDDRIYVSHFNRELSRVPDFYFAGNYSRMLDLFSVLYTTNNLTDTPHTDIVLRYARTRYFEKIGVDSAWYNEHETVERRKIFVFMLNNVFAALPRKVYESVSWRGAPFCFSYQNTFDGFCFEHPNLFVTRSYYPELEEALFRTRTGKISIFVQNFFRRSMLKLARLFNRFVR